VRLLLVRAIVVPSSPILVTLMREVFTAVTMKNGVFWDVTPCGSCKNQRFGGSGASFIRITRIGELEKMLAATSNRRTLRRNTKWLLVAACVVPSSPILVTLMIEALISF
jgi:hypothetical protein